MLCFSEASIKLVTKLKPDAIKIPSGEVNNLLLLSKLKNFKKTYNYIIRYEY